VSPTLFNIYVNDIISEWSNNDIKRLKISRNTEIKTLLFADVQVIMAESENLLQKSVHKLEKVTSKYGLTISTNKTKTMAFRGRDPIISKIVINNKIIEQINIFNYLGCSLSYETEKDITTKVSKFLQITGIISQVLKPSKVQRQTRLRIYITLAVPILLNGSEAWTLKEQDKSRITAAEIEFMRKTAKYTWQDHKRNQDITEELEIRSVMEKINNYKNKWIQHVRRMDRAGLTCYSEIPASRKKEPGTSFEETSGWMKKAGTGQEA
jgi:hypothetical protein